MSDARSESIEGDFFVTSSKTDIIVNVIPTSHSRDVIAEACRATNVWRLLTQERPHLNSLCELVHDAQVSLHAVITISTEHGALTKRSYSGALKCSSVSIKLDKKYKFKRRC